MRTKILAYTQNMNDACAFYRSTLPLAEMEKVCGVHVDYLDLMKPIGWGTFIHYRWFFATRPCTDKEITLINNAKIAGCRIWLDYDDDLFSIPMSNKAFSAYGEHAKENIRMAFLLADVITVTTEALKQKIIEESGFRANGKVFVVPNAETKFHKCSKKQKNIEKIVWRGSDTHAGDILAYKGEIKKILDTFPDIQFEFWGWNPWVIHDILDGKQFSVHSYPDPVQYLLALSHCEAAVGIVPLVFDDFNRAKSNIAEIEFQNAGIIPIVPSMDGWKSTTRYETVSEFSTVVIDAIRYQSPIKQKFIQLNEAAQMRYNIIMGST